MKKVKIKFDEKSGDMMKGWKDEKGVYISNLSAVQRSINKFASENIKKLQEENKNLNQEIKEIKDILENHNLRKEVYV